MASNFTSNFEKLPKRLTQWLGTTPALILHTFFFAGMFVFVLLGWDLGKMLLVLTTLLSIEAVYLALFIQMTVNQTSESLEDVEEDLEDIEKDIDVIQEDEKKDDKYDQEVAQTLKSIESRLNMLQEDLAVLKQKGLL